MKRFLLTAVCLIVSIPGFGQVTLKGIAVKMNSSFTPVAGVEVVAYGGVPDVTDEAGLFFLKLPDASSGDLVFDIRVSKKDMEVVNVKEIEQWVASEDILYKVVLCPKGQIEESRMRFYNVGKTYYQKEYERKLVEIKLERERQQADSLEFERSIAELNMEYDKRMKLLDFYADKFARINKDELSEMERQAFSLVENGQIDEAIQVYEQSGIVEKFAGRLSQRDSLDRSIEATLRLLRQQIDWYEKEGSETSLEKAGQLRALIGS